MGQDAKSIARRLARELKLEAAERRARRSAASRTLRGLNAVELEALNALMLEEDKLADEIALAVRNGPIKDTRAHADKVRRWWRLCEQILHAYNRDQSISLPFLMIVRLENVAGHLASGKKPHLVNSVNAGQAPKTLPAQRKAIGMAITYMRACNKNGVSHNGLPVRIVDKRPALTLARWYGVDENTVRGWGENPDYTPAALGRDYNDIVEYVKSAGEWYQKHGTSRMGHRHRATKQVPHPPRTRK